jgi:Zn-dependent protease with chaperone function
MELLLTLIFWAALVFGIYKWADSKGRNPTVWAVAAALISPLIVGIILLFVPKTLEKQADEAKKLKELMKED